MSVEMGYRLTRLQSHCTFSNSYLYEKLVLSQAE